VALLGGLLTTTLAADRAQSQSTNALLREQLSAETDALTGLPNRRAWQRLLDQARARYERLADPTVIAMLDLNRLKIINDSRGHAAGDAYLVTAAAAMQRALRDTDVVARLGGDEFASGRRRLLRLESCIMQRVQAAWLRGGSIAEALGSPAEGGYAGSGSTDVNQGG
jgi:GGDEF domain-containing protein